MKKKLALIRAKINAKSLAAEAKFIKSEITRAKDAKIKDNLYYHRMASVRPEARLTNLAIGFIKQKRRRHVEISSKDVDIKRLTRKINIFVNGPYSVYEPRITEEEVRAWYRDSE